MKTISKEICIFINITEQMSLLRSTGRKDIENSGYFRLFKENENDETVLKIAKMLSRIQACTIQSGCMLENDFICCEKYNTNALLKKHDSSMDIQQCHYSKFKILKEHFPKIHHKSAIEIDYIVIKENEIYIFEIKDGDNFDTKKSSSEYESLILAQHYFKTKFPTHSINIHIVLWNSHTITSNSIKVKDIPKEIVITGRAFCKLVGIKYEAITQNRMQYAKENKEWMKNQLGQILNSF
jgi:hypothetical protein